MQDIDSYRIGFSKNDCFVSVFDNGLEKYYHRFESSNPLLAKIKLLKKLLKEFIDEK